MTGTDATMHHCSPLPLVPGLPQKHLRKTGDEQRWSRGEGKSRLSFYGDKPNLSTPSGSEERLQGCWDASTGPAIPLVTPTLP